jgi:hypothetical protein
LNKNYFSHKFHHAGLRYLIACSVGTTRKIIWWGGGVACGSNPDLKIAREQFVSILKPGERCLADKGFPDERYFKTPFFRPVTDFAFTFNRQHKLEMACHESINKRIKQFAILRSFRHGADFKHNIVFGAIIQITQLCLEDEPMYCPVYE